MKILAIGAHYDDVEIGCGGMLLKRSDKGDEITILTITDSGYSVPNTKITLMSKSFIEFIIYSYFENKRRINDPLIPGRIIAVIAIEPVKNI